MLIFRGVYDMWISYPPRNIYAGSTLPRFYISCLGYQEGKMYKRLKKERSFAPIFVEHPSSWWFPSNPKAKKRSLFRGRIRSFCRLKLRHPDGFVEASICSAMVHGCLLAKDVSDPLRVYEVWIYTQEVQADHMELKVTWCKIASVLLSEEKHPVRKIS